MKQIAYRPNARHNAKPTLSKYLRIITTVNQTVLQCPRINVDATTRHNNSLMFDLAVTLTMIPRHLEPNQLSSSVTSTTSSTRVWSTGLYDIALTDARRTDARTHGRTTRKHNASIAPITDRRRNKTAKVVANKLPNGGPREGKPSSSGGNGRMPGGGNLGPLGSPLLHQQTQEDNI